jgi:beta-galactosidase
MQGFSDPIFRNVITPFHPNPPYAPKEYNPTGSYRRTFIIPSSWKNKEVFLRMEKTASASFIWINGEEVGYNEGAQEPAEYNVTKYLRNGKNTIAVLVTKYSDGYYLEDQDYWRLAGIFDDVWLFATSKTHIFDWYATTDLDNTYTDARLSLSVDLKNYSTGSAEEHVLRAVLYNHEKKMICTIISDKLSLPPSSKQTVKLSAEIINPDKWSSEKPNLYNLTFELLNSSGKTIEVIAGRMGFKETEIRNQVFYLNGVPVKLNGINSHMQHPTLGHMMNEETIRKDLRIFKQFNINCVRTSHYPPVIRYLELADERLFNFNAHPYSVDNLTKALYTYQLQPFDEITFNFDYATSGVGCTALSVFTEYLVIPQRYDFTVNIKPIRGDRQGATGNR